MAHILICDDEQGLRTVLSRYARHEGYAVTEAKDGLEAVERCRQHAFDLIIMDIMMPKLDGFSAVKEIKKHRDSPVLMLSARGEEYDKVLGFELGIDDYVVKPFSSKEVMMRIAAILRRVEGQVQEVKVHDVYSKDGLHVDRSAYKVSVDGQARSLSPKEYDLLFYFLDNKNIVVSRTQIMDAVWGLDYEGDDRTLDTHIKLLRRSISPYGSFITTIRGLGYRFDG